MAQNNDQLNEEADRVHNYFTFKAGSFMVPRRSHKNHNKGRVDSNNKYAIQCLYEAQKHRAIQEILFGPTYYCKIDKEKLENHYVFLLGIAPKCSISELADSLWPKMIPTEQDNLLIIQQFTPKEIRQKLKMKLSNFLCDSRSVGLDRLHIRDLLKIDPDCLILANLFNSCLRLQMIPDIWRESYSVLVKQNKCDDMNVKNWRIVTLQNSIPKIFQSLCASRLISWAKRTGRLSETQKGFRFEMATCICSFILQECKRDAEKNEKDLAVAWLNFAEAADWIPQAAVNHALLRHSVPLPIRHIIQNIIEGSKTKIRTNCKSLFTTPIPIRKGLHQGSPLNPILVDLTIDPILRRLSMESDCMFHIFNKKINHIVIPNELTLIAESDNQLQDLLHIVEKTARIIGLHFNIQKCSTYHYDHKNKQVKGTTFSFFSQKLNTLSENTCNEFFGVRQGLCIGQEGIPSIKEMLDSVQKIDESGLTRFQKLESFLIYILPRAENYLRGLQDVNDTFIEQADQILMQKIKSWLSLPDDTATKSIVYHVASQLKNNIQYLPFVDLFHAMKIVHALQMLSSSDDLVKSIATDSLKAEVSQRINKKTKKDLSMDKVVKYLSGDYEMKISKPLTIWQMVRDATVYLKSKVQLTWQYKNNTIQLHLKTRDNKNIILNGNSTNIEKHFKNTIIAYYVNNCI